MNSRDRILFESDGVSVRGVDFERGLAAVGVREGDALFVHSDIAMFGKLSIKNRTCLLESICAALFGSVGQNGTVIMPTFTYSFCKGELYDVENSPSTVGVLTEYFRQRSDVVRTDHPLFSAAIWGCEKEWYLDIGIDSFDDRSIFGKLRERKGKLVFLGTPFDQACTYVHHIEQMHGVPYRYTKSFSGAVRAGGEMRAGSCTYYVRDLALDPQTDLGAFHRYLCETGLLQESQVGHGRIASVQAAALYEVGRRFLSDNVHGFLRRQTNAMSVLQER